jgi:hypothetical protein
MLFCAMLPLRARSSSHPVCVTPRTENPVHYDNMRDKLNAQKDIRQQQERAAAAAAANR